MPVYQYQCPEKHITDLRRPIDRRNDRVACGCGKEAMMIFSLFNFSFGWKLSDASHERGAVDELVRNI